MDGWREEGGSERKIAHENDLQFYFRERRRTHYNCSWLIIKFFLSGHVSVLWSSCLFISRAKCTNDIYYSTPSGHDVVDSICQGHEFSPPWHDLPSPLFRERGKTRGDSHTYAQERGETWNTCFSRYLRVACQADSTWLHAFPVKCIHDKFTALSRSEMIFMGFEKISTQKVEEGQGMLCIPGSSSLPLPPTHSPMNHQFLQHLLSTLSWPHTTPGFHDSSKTYIFDLITSPKDSKNLDRALPKPLSNQSTSSDEPIFP